jgi:formate dehydrogenase subunit gamma
LDAGPVLWPLAHEVRPEEQSLGAAGCTECHAEDAPFFEAIMAGTGPLTGADAGSVAFTDLLEMPESAVAWGAWRERIVKSLTLPVTITLVILFLLHYALFGSHMHRPREKEIEIPRHNALSRVGHYLLFLSVFAVAGTGFLFLLGTADPLGTEGQRLARDIHWIAGLGMSVGFVVIGVVWFRRMLWASYDMDWLRVMGGYLGGGHKPPAGKFNAGQKMFFWLTILVGGVLVVTGIAMLIGTQGSPVWQAAIYTIHDAAGLAMIILILLHVYLSVLVDPHSIRSVFGGRVHASWAKERHPKWEAEIGKSSGE